MKHIGKSNENEIIVSLKIEDINELMMLANSAMLRYIKQKKNRPNDKGLEMMYKDAVKWWDTLYDVRETI